MSSARIIDRPRLGERIELVTTGSGVRVALSRKPGFSTSAGYFGVRFGSADTHFETNGERLQVPDGSAHFLEHKLFEGRSEKVFDRFGRIGARFNGGTGFHTTTYYFVSAGRFEEGLDVLLDFVQHPLLTAERVEKEKGIIEQEVRMYEDDPGFRGTFLLHRALYHNLHIRIPPGGTVASVQGTTVDDLRACYAGFYRPAQLILSLAGDFDPQHILGRVEAALDPARDGAARSLVPAEPEQPAADWKEEEFTVSRPHVWIGWRDAAGTGLGQPLLERRILSTLVLNLALDLSSPYHASLYDAGVVDDSFAAFYRCDASYGYAAATGLSDKPEEFVREVRAAVGRFAAEGPAAEDFERVKHAAWGSVVSGLQSPESVAGSTLHALLDELEPLATLDVLEGITLDMVAARARELFRKDNSAVAVLRPARAGS